MAEQKKLDTKNTLEPTIATVSRKDQRKLEAEHRLKQKPLYDALKKAEQAVEKLHQEQRQLEQQLADPAIYEDSEKARLKQVMTLKMQVDKALSDAETAWLEAEENIEATKAC